MDVFDLRTQVIDEYGDYVQSFLTIQDPRIRTLVDHHLDDGFLWPDPLIQMNPAFEPGQTLDDLVRSGDLHPECVRIFASKNDDGAILKPFQLHRHQIEGVRAANAAQSYVLTTGTGSGKSLAYIVPIVDHVLKTGSGQGLRAIIVYPMNALANSQLEELKKFLQRGYRTPPVTFARYTGQENEADRHAILTQPPDILLTNYVMLELLLTRPRERALIHAARHLRFLVLDELHTYRGRQGADVAALVRRVRQACRAPSIIHVGTSATMSTQGSWPQQQAQVAQVASRLFGDPVHPHRVIGESLRRLTPDLDFNQPAHLQALRRRLQSGPPPRQSLDDFRQDPLSCWIESNIGLRQEPSGRLVRCTPRPIEGPQGAAATLASLTDLDQDLCKRALIDALMDGYRHRDDDDRPAFAFRLHQLVSKGESVFASLEPEDSRHLTLQAQRFAPDSDRQKILLPLAFCRECGQEYYVVWRSRDGRLTPRSLSDHKSDLSGEPGFLYASSSEPWPDDPERYLDRLPDSWLVPDNDRQLKPNRRLLLPSKRSISTDGQDGRGPLTAWWINAPFRFCLRCSVAYNARQSSDFGKLATLGSEGRSTATTVLTLSTIRRLRQNPSLPHAARKLLSFTDNRQDASLQAGHFNDFVEIMLLRSALWRAADRAGAAGLRHDTLTQAVFDLLDLPTSAYALQPDVKYHAREETDRALREVLGYFLYRDLRRGWRVTSPNLEQCGLLDIQYSSLNLFCADDAEWRHRHHALANASPHTRAHICQILLDFLRRDLVLRAEPLDARHQETVQKLSEQHLTSPWTLERLDQLERSRVVFPRPRGASRDLKGRYLFLSPRGGLGLFLRRHGVFPDLDRPLTLDDVALLIPDLLDALTVPGILHPTLPPRDGDDAPGYQLNASALIWKAGDGTRALHDPIRVPRQPEAGLRTNPFFKNFYRSNTDDLKQLFAREHTAQVTNAHRIEREAAFRDASLPILYCSPTMELGVDIAQLNVVNMRNVPPTPANYAQRSGRAGRSGQPAFVFTYCAAGSPHDQYFFKRPHLMVAGSVTPPRLDIGNEDLLRAHVHAIWLATSRLDLGRSLQDVVDVSGPEPSLQLLPPIRDALHDADHAQLARIAAEHALGDAISEMLGDLDAARRWLDTTLDDLAPSLDRACQRWRDLFLAARRQVQRQNELILDPSRDPQTRKAATLLRQEAEAQLRLLLDIDDQHHQSDFYTYRYFASEGFLPGYNFPRLPLSAYLPGSRARYGQHEFITRPRFLAISEFGPRAIIYHEGSRYIINKVLLPVEAERDGGVTLRGARCRSCGYVYTLGTDPAPDLCHHCHQPSLKTLHNLFRMQSVSTRRRDRINSDEEERLRLGYDLKTGLRFANRHGRTSARRADLLGPDLEALGAITYAHAATLWRINVGWSARKPNEPDGFTLDVERGFWAKDNDNDDPDDPLSRRTQRVIPFVEDHRNCLTFDPGPWTRQLAQGDSPAELKRATARLVASLTSALKSAIQIHFQLEDREIAAEPLPDDLDRQQILFYEASEGGAGVLRHLVDDPLALPAVARIALELCHFDPDSGLDLHLEHPEPCVAACYNCLLSYSNQRDHILIDRHLLPTLLLRLARASVHPEPPPPSLDPDPQPRSPHLQQWLDLLARLDLAQPDPDTTHEHGQTSDPLLRDAVDFTYARHFAAILIGRAPDALLDDHLIDLGWTPVRFSPEPSSWHDTLLQHAYVFGQPRPDHPTHATTTPTPTHLDLDLFDEPWHTTLAALHAPPDLAVHPGQDILAGDRVVASSHARLSTPNLTLHLIDARQHDADAASHALSLLNTPHLTLSPHHPDALSILRRALNLDDITPRDP